jgi:hypothetical protein
MKCSYSQSQTYISCPAYWNWLYNEKLQSPEQGASLHFGSALDGAIEHMLKGDQNYIQKYEKAMDVQFHFGKQIVFFDNPAVVYSYSDFDKELLTDSDIDQLKTWALDLKLYANANQSGYKLRQDMVSLYEGIVKIKKNPYKKMTSAQKMFFNRASWLSLKRKGYYMIESFKEQFYPKITKVLSTQTQAFIKDPSTGDSIQGFIDMILEIEGYDKPIIFDLKTAARPYTQDQIDHSAQLTLYAGMKGPEYNTNLVGYVVLCKNINKEKVATCKSCGNVRNGRHKTCDADINGIRCGGEWDEKIVPKPEVQVMVQEKSQEEINSVFMDMGNIISAMKQKIIYKDTSKCENWYGSRCQYYNACHKNDLTGLVKK